MKEVRQKADLPSTADLETADSETGPSLGLIKHSKSICMYIYIYHSPKLNYGRSCLGDQRPDSNFGVLGGIVQS